MSWPARREGLLPWCFSRVSTISSRACIFRVCSREVGGERAWWLPEPTALLDGKSLLEAPVPPWVQPPLLYLR